MNFIAQDFRILNEKILDLIKIQTLEQTHLLIVFNCKALSLLDLKLHHCTVCFIFDKGLVELSYFEQAM